MKNFKYLPVAVAVAASLASFSALAADDVAITDAQLLELTERLRDLEATVKENGYIYDQQPVVLTPEIAEVKDDDLGFFFSGYARYGAAYQAGDSKYVNVGSSGRSVGRLGNEVNGGELQFAHVVKTDNGIVWNVAAMFDQWADRDWGSDGGVDLKKMYAGVTNFSESQPNLYVWAGRNFHQRPQQGLNDYFWMTHDGQGGGFNNLTFGGVKFDMGFVGQVDSDGASFGGDNGIYALTSKLHGIDLGIGDLDLYANYGFASEQADDAKQDEKAFQLGATLGLGDSHKITAKYADGADNSVYELAGDKQVIYVSLEGGFHPTEPLFVDYLVSYKNIAGDDATDQSEYSAIVRPMYNWNEVHSTWFEAGYAIEDYDDGGDKQGWKATLSQNISMGGLPWSRPMVRLYATVGDVETTGTAPTTNVDTLTAGLMFEAWW